MKIAGATVFVTGGAQGIGLGLARAFARHGAHVALCDIDDACLAQAADNIPTQHGTEVITIRLDVRDRDGFADAARRVERALGPVTILCNNAGIAGSAPADDLTYQHWDAVLGINLGGVVNGIQTFLPGFLARREPAHIVNTSAGAGLSALGGVSLTGTMYQTSKYAVAGLTESLSENLKRLGMPIGLSLLCPGPVPTNITRRSFEILAEPDRAVSVEEKSLQDAAIALSQAILARGMPIDEVGERTVAAVRSGQFYIHTDRLLEQPVKDRTAAILAAMPEYPSP